MLLLGSENGGPMRSKKLLTYLLAAGAALSAGPALTGCTGSARFVVESETAPPPPRAERVAYRQGYVWVPGHWERSRAGWRWSPGYYERERRDHVYVHGRWERRGRSHVWVDGRWEPRGRVTVRALR